MEISSDKLNLTVSPILELVRDASSNHSQPERPSLLETSLTDSKSTEWTDEKHSLYLGSMETSFVNQLYDSVNFFRKCCHRNTQSHKLKVLKRGCWQKIVYEGEKPRQSGVLLSPWIQRFRSLKIPKPETSPSPGPYEASTSGQESNLRRKPSSSFSEQPAIGCSNVSVNNLLCNDIVEVSDQNFVDEESEKKWMPTSHC